MKNNQAFTLIEVLVVIGIIGILAGSLITLISGQSESAKNAKIKGEISQINKSLAMYKYINNFAPYPIQTTVCLVKDCVATQIGVTTGIEEEIYYQTNDTGTSYVIWAMKVDSEDENDYFYMKTNSSQIQEADDATSAPIPN